MGAPKLYIYIYIYICVCVCVCVKVKVEQSRYRTGVAQRVPGGLPDFMTTAQDGGKTVSPTHRPPLPPGNAPDTHFF